MRRSTNRDSWHVHIDIPFDCHIHSSTCGFFNLRRRRRRHYIRLICINNREAPTFSDADIRKPKINWNSYDLLFSIFELLNIIRRSHLYWPAQFIENDGGIYYFTRSNRVLRDFVLIFWVWIPLCFHRFLLSVFNAIFCAWSVNLTYRLFVSLSIDVRMFGFE